MFLSSSYVQHKHNTALMDTSYFLSQLLATYVSSCLPLITFLVGLDVVPLEWSIFQALLPPPVSSVLVFIAAK